MKKTKKDYKKEAEELRNHRLQRSSEFQYGFPPIYIFGKDKQAVQQGLPASDVDKYNGLIAQPGGSAVQFLLDDYIPKGEKEIVPLILTMASQDPANLGEYQNDKFLLTEKNIKDRTYLISARPPDASLSLFQHDMMSHFLTLQKYKDDLNLLGLTDFFRYRESNPVKSVRNTVAKAFGNTDEEKKDFYFGQYLSKHVSYVIVQIHNERHPPKDLNGTDDDATRYVVLKKYGPGKLNYDSGTYPIFTKSMINIGNLRRGVAPWGTEFVNLAEKPGVKLSSAKHCIYGNSTLANEAIIKDFSVCFKNLWNMDHASGKKSVSLGAFFVNAVQTGKLQTALFRGALSGAIAQATSSVLSGGAAPPTVFPIALAIALGTDVALSQFGDRVADFTLNPWRGKTERLRKRLMSARSQRDYTDELVVPEHLASGRQIRRMKPEFKDRAQRLMAVHDDPNMATSLYLPIDPILPTDPFLEGTTISEAGTEKFINPKSPFALYLANVTGGTAGNLSRDVTPDISLGTTPTGMVAMSIVSDFNKSADPEKGYHLPVKPNVVTKFVTFVKDFQTDQHDHYATARSALSSEREKNKEKNKDNNKMEFVGIEKWLDGRVAHIVINRREGKFSIDLITKGELQQHLYTIFRDNVPLSPSNEQKKYYGLGYEDEAFMRLQHQFGIDKRQFLDAPDRTMTARPA